MHLDQAILFAISEKHAYHAMIIVRGTAILAGVRGYAVGTCDAEPPADVGEADRGEQQGSEEYKLHVWAVIVGYGLVMLL